MAPRWPQPRLLLLVLLLLVVVLAGLTAPGAAFAGSRAPFLLGSSRSTPTPSSSSSALCTPSGPPLLATADGGQQQPQQQQQEQSRRAHLGSLLSVVTGAAVLGATPTPGVWAVGVDEYEVRFEGGQGLGLAIEDFGKGGKYRTYVSRVIKGSQAERSSIRIPALVVAVNGRNVEGLPKSFVVKLLKEAQQQGGPVVVTFRDPAKCVMGTG
jgi:hypothetical protein